MLDRGLSSNFSFFQIIIIPSSKKGGGQMCIPLPLGGGGKGGVRRCRERGG